MSTANTPLIFTENAANKVYQLIQEEGNPSLNLRVFVEGGGCSGFKYGFTFDDIINPDDTIIEKTLNDSAQVKLLIDMMSFPYLQGAEIDYKDDLEGSRFVIRNPNANTTCGCGSSFSA